MPAATQPGSWESLEKGLEYAEFKSGLFPSPGDSTISVLRIDPRHYRFRYLVASEFDSTNLLPRDWVETHGLTAAINAGMYAKDYLTHVGYSKNWGKVHNARLLKTYKSILAFDPAGPGLPEVRLFDLACENFDSFKNKYNTLIQNIRMISCHGGNVWSQKKDQWSAAALGQDKAGNILFLFSSSPYSVHDFIEILLRLPLSLSRAMYLEGGSPAGLYIKTKSGVIQKSGLPEGRKSGLPAFSLTLPNVIGIVKKPD
ncbi:phosphodiester glycosidase family protein [Fibrobacterota bacterium]